MQHILSNKARLLIEITHVTLQPIQSVIKLFVKQVVNKRVAMSKGDYR